MVGCENLLAMSKHQDWMIPVWQALVTTALYLCSQSHSELESYRNFVSLLRVANNPFTSWLYSVVVITSGSDPDNPGSCPGMTSRKDNKGLVGSKSVGIISLRDLPKS